nr:YadA-like family protein [uncultured Dialister sp.]
MNKIYKVMYSKVKQCAVVVSEIAKSHGKSSTRNNSIEHCTGRKLTAMVLAALIGVTLGIATPGTSFAWDGEENQEPGTHATVVGGKGNSAWGTDATIAGGSDNNTGAFGAVVVGGHKNVASTYNANTTDENFYIENSTVVGGESNISLGGYSTLVGGTSGVVRGLYSTGIAGGSTDRYARYALAAGYGAVVTNDGVRRIETPVETPSGTRMDITYDQVSTALGYQATANQAGTISFGHDAGDVSGYTVEWVQDKPDALGVYHHSNGDDHNLYDEPPLIKETKYDTAYYNRLVKIANGINSHDAVTMGQMATADNTKANVAADNIGSKLQVVEKDDSGNAVTDSKTGLPVMVDASADEKTANETAWGTAIGTGAIEKDNGQLVTGGTVYNSMLTKANIDMDNISDGGKTVVRNLAKDAVKVVDGSHTYVTSKEDGNATAYSVNIKTGQVASGVSDLVTGGTVYDAIQSAKISGTGGADFDLTGKAEVGAGNVGANLSKFSSDNLTDQQKLAEKTTNENDWGTALGTGKIASAYGDTSVTDNNGSKQLVKGDTVYKEVRPEDGKYVKTAQTTAKNLKELDSAIQQQAKELTNSLSVKAGWGINKTDDNTISVKHNLSSGDNAYADTDATGLVLGGFVKDGDASKQYGATAETSVIVGGQNALASGVGSVVTGGMDNVASGRNSTVVGGDANNAAGNRSAVLGGRDNTAGGIASVAGGGIMNVANGQQSVALGGAYNYALGTNSTAIGGMGGNGMYGYNTSVNGSYSVSLAGGSTGADALNGLAAGNQSVVTTANGTAVGYQATTDEAGTIAFGHDKDDVSGYTVNWKQRTDGKTNADLTTNDYTQAPESVTATTYTDSYYNRLVKVAEGQDDHDVVVVKQLKQYAQKDAGNIGSNIKVYTTDENGNSVEDTDASTAAQKANEKLWGTAIGTGKIADSKATNAADNGSQQLVTGGTVYTYNAPVAESGKTLNYVSADKTTGQNLTALDTQVKANADTLNDSTHNIKYYSVNGENLPGFGQADTFSNAGNKGAAGRGSLAAGAYTYTAGLASTVAGSYSGIYNKGTVSGTDFRGAAALSYGTVNINRNTDTSKAYSGVANSLIGQANMTTNSNAAIILGAGNTVKDSYRTISNLNLSGDMTAALKEAVPGSGGQVMVMGGGNSVENAYMTQVTGVGNTVTGSGEKYDKDSSTQLNYVDGFYTTLENGKNDYIIGSHNTVTGTSTDKNKSNIVFGDNHTLTDKSNNIIIGSAAKEGTPINASDAVIIGQDANSSVDGGVAIGSGSVASTAAGVAGYDPTGATADSTSSAWKSKKAAVSIGTANETRQITGLAAGKEETDAVNVAQLKKLNGMKANVNADNIGTKLNAGATDEEKAAQQTNLDNWGTAIGTGTIASTSNQLVTGKTVYAYNKPVAAEGKTLNYVSDTKTTGQNLGSLDAQVGTNTGDISNLKNLSNITETGQTVIKNLSKDAVKVAQGERVTVDTSTDATGATVYTVSANNNGQVTDGDQNLVPGDTVNTAITNAITNAGTATDTKLAGKANVDASNIGTKLNAGATDEEKAAQQTNLDNWGTAIGTGTIASTSNQLVTGKTVYAYNKPVAAEGKTLNYVSDTKTTGQNLGSLDAQVGTNTGDISNLKNLSNISSAGETVIKNLAKGSIGMENGSHTTVSHRDANGVETYKVDVNVDGKVESGNKGIVDGGAVYSAIQDVKNQTSADLANKANVDASNLTPDNVTKWQEKLGNGEVVSGNKGLVTGDTVFKAVDTKANRDGSNLTDNEADSFSEKIARGEVKADENRAVSGDAVSQAISKVTGDMNTKLDGKANTSLDNITDTGENVIRDLAKGSVKVIEGTNTTVTAVDGEGETPTTYAVNVEGKGTVTSGNTGLISGGTAYTELRPADGTYVKRSSTTAANLSALDTGLKNTSSLIHTNTSGDTIHIGETSKASKVDVSSTDANGNKNGRVITGVISDAGDPNSAVNVGYVNGVTAANTQQIYRDMNSAYGRLNNTINKAAAGSNALAALHPLDYDPDDKADFAVGYGHYRNANAAAVGAFYHPNENTMVNVGVSLGNGDPGFNAGVSFKIGSGSAGREAMSKTEMAKVINSQSKEIDALKKDNADKDKRIDALEQKMAEILAKLDKNGK